MRQKAAQGIEIVATGDTKQPGPSLRHLLRLSPLHAHRCSAPITKGAYCIKSFSSDHVYVQR